MIVPYLIFDETGVYVVGAGHSKNPPEDVMELPSGMNPEKFLRHYIFEGRLTPRPIVEPPMELPAGGYCIENCPKDCRITIIDNIGQEDMAVFIVPEDGHSFEFDLPDSGNYSIEIEPLAPYTNTRYIIEVI